MAGNATRVTGQGVEQHTAATRGRSHSSGWLCDVPDCGAGCIGDDKRAGWTCDAPQGHCTKAPNFQTRLRWPSTALAGYATVPEFAAVAYQSAKTWMQEYNCEDGVQAHRRHRRTEFPMTNEPRPKRKRPGSITGIASGNSQLRPDRRKGGAVLA